MYYINGKTISLRDINERIKNGITVEEYAKIYEVSEDVFKEKLREISRSDYSTHLRRMEKNQKQKNKHNRADKNDETIIMPVEEEKMAENNANAFEVSREDELKKLIESYENELTQISNNQLLSGAKLLEIEGKRSEINKELLEIAETVKKFQQSLVDLGRERDQTLQQQAELKAKLEEIKDMKKAAEDELETYLVVVISYDFSSGLHVSQDGFEPTPDEISAKVCEISSLEKFDEYSLKMIKAAATVICVAESVNILGMRYSVDYEKCNATVSEIIKEFILEKEVVAA